MPIYFAARAKIARGFGPSSQIAHEAGDTLLPNCAKAGKKVLNLKHALATLPLLPVTRV
jgi:hypothetical protein